MKTLDDLKKGLEYLSAKYVAEKVSLAKQVKYYIFKEDIAADALAYIKQLEAQVPKWISVDVMLPKEVKRDDEEVSSSDLVIVAVRDDMNNIFVSDDILCKGEWVNYPAPLFEVTHWMPLPEPPKEGKHGI